MMSGADVERFFKVQFADVLICHFLYGLIKISVVLFYKRIFQGKTFNACANVVLVLIGMFMAISFFVSETTPSLSKLTYSLSYSV